MNSSLQAPFPSESHREAAVVVPPSKAYDERRRCEEKRFRCSCEF